jgi:CRISPR-associated protein Cas5t
LLLNVAGVESRLPEEDSRHDGKVPASLTVSGLPTARIALGVPTRDGILALPTVQTLFQQLHNYPVGAQSGVPAKLAMGNKNNIAPVRREVLCGVHAKVFVDGNADLEGRVLRGLQGGFNEDRYGLPFIGDNQFLIDRLRESPEGEEAFWYTRVGCDSAVGPRPNTTRLTIWIDRADMSRTISDLYAPTEVATLEPPEDAWTTITPP